MFYLFTQETFLKAVSQEEKQVPATKIYQEDLGIEASYLTKVKESQVLTKKEESDFFH